MVNATIQVSELEGIMQIPDIPIERKRSIDGLISIYTNVKAKDGDKTVIYRGVVSDLSFYQRRSRIYLIGNLSLTKSEIVPIERTKLVLLQIPPIRKFVGQVVKEVWRFSDYSCLLVNEDGVMRKGQQGFSSNYLVHITSSANGKGIYLKPELLNAVFSGMEVIFQKIYDAGKNLFDANLPPNFKGHYQFYTTKLP